MTEAGALTAPSLSVQVATPGNASAGATSASVGKILPGVLWKVIHPDGSPAERGEKGELWVKSPSLATGYRENLESLVHVPLPLSMRFALLSLPLLTPGNL